MALELVGELQKGFAVSLLDGGSFLHICVDVLQKQAFLRVLGLK